MIDQHSARCWNIVIGVVAVIFSVSFFVAHWVWVDVAELTKDTFEPFALGTLPVSRDTQHRLLFALVGSALAFSGGVIAKDFFRTQGVARWAVLTFASVSLWFVFLASLAIACSIFYRAAFD